MKRLKQSLLVLGVMLMSGVTLLAATWDGSQNNSLWTDAANWDTDPSIPPSGDNISFPSVGWQTVDLNGGSYGIGTLTFNSPNAYSLGNGASPGLTLGGDFSQNNSGAVTLNVGIDLGGATRVFNGTGSGVVTFNSPVTGDGYRATLNGGNYVIANNANTIDRWEIINGAKATIVGSGSIPLYNNPSYFGGNGGASFGGYYIKLDGGTLDFQATETGDTPSWGTAPKDTATMGADWWDRAIIFGPNGGTLLWTNAAPGGGIGTGSSTRNGPSIYYSQGGKGTIVVGQPLPWTGDPWDGTVASTNRFRSPFEVEYGFSLGIYQNSSLHNASANVYLKWRQGSGDIEVVLTNGASAYLDWNVMTNGNLIISGQPGGDSSVIETNATGWTRNVGRLAIRGPHRTGAQYSISSAADAPAWAAVGVIDRSFYMDQPYGMVFNNAVQVWNRDGMERLACDMSFENGSSVDFCGGRRNTGLDLGHCGNAAISQAGPTNTMTIKSGAKCNLNLQLRSNIGDGRTSPWGESAGLRVWSFIDIKDGGELKIYRSQTNAMGRSASGGGGVASKCIELFRPVTGNGSSAADARFVLDLPWSPKSNGNKSGGGTAGDNGVNFEANPASMGGSYPGALAIVNGSGDYGLRVEGKAAYLTNFLYTVRSGSGVDALTGLTGSGGTFTVAVTDGGTIDIAHGPSSSVSVALGIASGSNPHYVLGADGSMNNFNGLVHKGGTAVVLDGTIVTMKTLKLAAAEATIKLGEFPGSGAKLNFDNSSGVAWSAGTLIISNWNGSLLGGGLDQIKVGTSAGGLTPAQLAQIKWSGPYGDGYVYGAVQLASGEIVPPGILPSSIVPPNPGTSTPLSATVQGAAGVNYRVLASDDVEPPSWTQIATGTGTFSFNDPASLTKPQRFYKVVTP